ncbi:MAG: hypothetical protein ABJE95_11450 [Byssovorax sp.]
MIRAALALALALGIGIAIAGCGYTLANTPDAALPPFTVRAAEARTPDGSVISAAINGAESELSRAGLLAVRGDGAVLTIAILRVAERSEGIAAGITTNATPIARGIRLTIAARATTTAPARDSGEIEVSEVFATPESATIGLLARDEAAQRAGLRLGQRLARRVLGDVDPGEP